MRSASHADGCVLTVRVCVMPKCRSSAHAAFCAQPRGFATKAASYTLRDCVARAMLAASEDCEEGSAVQAARAALGQPLQLTSQDAKGYLNCRLSSAVRLAGSVT